MARIPEYPPILMGTAEQKIEQLRDFLMRMVRESEDIGDYDDRSGWRITGQYVSVSTGSVPAGGSVLCEITAPQISGFRPFSVAEIRFRDGTLSASSGYIEDNKAKIKVTNSGGTAASDTMTVLILYNNQEAQ